jgi:5-carboxymethyl-2-hydroxymuconate isomerase
MPHIHLEYSDNVELDCKTTLMAVNQAFIGSGHVSNPNDLKSRASCQHDYLIGLTPDQAQGYVHAKVSLLTGRSIEIQQHIAALILEALEQSIPKQSRVSLQLCVEMSEMPKETYAKQVRVV